MAGLGTAQTGDFRTLLSNTWAIAVGKEDVAVCLCDASAMALVATLWVQLFLDVRHAATLNTRKMQSLASLDRSKYA